MPAPLSTLATVPVPLLVAAGFALTAFTLGLLVAAFRAAGQACYRIDRDAYRRAQHEWAVYRRSLSEQTAARQRDLVNTERGPR